MGVTTSTTTGAVGMAVCDGAGGEAFTGGTINYRFGENPSSGSNAAGNTIGGTFISTGGLHTVTWTQTNGYYGAIAAEVLVASAGTSRHRRAARCDCRTTRNWPVRYRNTRYAIRRAL